MRKQNFVKAAHWLTYIKTTNLSCTNLNIVISIIYKGLTLAQEHPAKVEPLMKKALEYGLNMKHDRAMATLNIAAAALSKGRKAEAQKLLEEAKRLDDQGMMADQIKMMKDQLKMPSMQKHMHNPQMRHRGKFF